MDGTKEYRFSDNTTREVLISREVILIRIHHKDKNYSQISREEIHNCLWRQSWFSPSRCSIRQNYFGQGWSKRTHKVRVCSEIVRPLNHSLDQVHIRSLQTRGWQYLVSRSRKNLQALQENKICELVELLECGKAISEYGYKKNDTNKNVERYKACFGHGVCIEIWLWFQ